MYNESSGSSGNRGRTVTLRGTRRESRARKPLSRRHAHFRRVHLLGVNVAPQNIAFERIALHLDALAILEVQRMFPAMERFILFH